MRIAGIYPYDTELDPKIQHEVSEPYIKFLGKK